MVLVFGQVVLGMVAHYTWFSGKNFVQCQASFYFTTMILSASSLTRITIHYFALYLGKQTSAIDKWHWHVGRVVLLISFFNVVIGIETFSK